MLNLQVNRPLMKIRTQDIVLRQKITQRQHQQQQIIADLQKQLFTTLKLQYEVNDIPIDEDQSLHTVFLPAVQKNLQNPENFFFSHGFGGSSLMKFPVIGHLLKKGNLILWEIRGMGLNQKVDKYEQKQIDFIQSYFLQGIKTILRYYKPTNATFICHSFSSYLTLLFTIRNEQLTKKHIKQLLMLSPIGITPKEEDYKRQITSCSDLLHTITHKLGWAFHLSYKSPLRTICACCKKRLVMNSLLQQNLSEQDRQLVYKIIQVLIMLPDGSECFFFQYFQPRVLPKVALEPLFISQPHIPIVLVYGGQGDWVDRTGAEKISTRFPEKIKKVQIPGITHNIAFHTVQCRQLFQQLFP